MLVWYEPELAASVGAFVIYVSIVHARISVPCINRATRLVVKLPDMRCLAEILSLDALPQVSGETGTLPRGDQSL